MMGRLIGVVGPSGVGKDTVMQALAASPGLSVVRRVITRAPELGGEDYIPVDEASFQAREAAGAFCISWQAHGLRYGIPVEAINDVHAGETLLVNLSRAVLCDVADIFDDFLVLNLTANPETLAARLAGRGRETQDEIHRRLARKTAPLPDHLNVLTIANNGPLGHTVQTILTHLRPAEV